MAIHSMVLKVDDLPSFFTQTNTNEHSMENNVLKAWHISSIQNFGNEELVFWSQC